MHREEKTREKQEMKKDESFDVFKTEKTIQLIEDGGVLKEILKSGSGVSPHEGCACDVHYVGRLSDGTVFDSSRQRKKPFRFILGEKNVIEGWNIAVRTMKGRELSRVVITPKYAYGEKGQAPKIPGNATLIFEMELVCWYSNPKSAPAVKRDPEPESAKRKRERALKRREERIEALTKEENRIKSRALKYNEVIETQIERTFANIKTLKDQGNVKFKAKKYEEALRFYEKSIEEILSIDKSDNSTEPERLEDLDTEEAYVQLCKMSRSIENDEETIKSVDNIIERTVEEATLTSEVKERLKLLESTEESGSKAAKTDPDLANRLLHDLKRKLLVKKFQHAHQSLHSSLLTNCSVTLLRLERYEDSRDRALRALQISPMSRKALHRSAMACAKLKSAADAERAVENMASSIAMAEKDSRLKSSRVALYEMCLESSSKFFRESGIRLEDGKNDEKKQGRRCFAEKHFRPGDVIWTESSCLLSRVSFATTEKVAHRDALLMLLSKHTNATSLSKFAQTIGKMLALYPMRCFTEIRLKELRDKEKCSKSMSWASERYGEDVDWFELTPSFIQRVNWSMDDESRRFLSVVFEPLPFEIVTKMILETIVLNSHDMSIGGFGLGFHTSFVNHSCWPNVDVHLSEPSKGLIVRAVRDIEPGEEILMSYTDIYDVRDERLRTLYRHYDFVCCCVRCEGAAEGKEPGSYKGKTPALVEIDTQPYVAKGAKDDLMHHHKIFEDRLIKIRWQCDRSIARGKETKAREEALSALEKWLDDAKHFYCRYHPTRFEALYMAAVHALKLCRIESGAHFIRECDEIHASMYPSFWPWGRINMITLRELSQYILGKAENIEEARRCAKTRDVLRRTYEKNIDVVDGGTERNSVLLSLMRLLLKFAEERKVEVSQELISYIEDAEKLAVEFEHLKTLRKHEQDEKDGECDI